MFRFVRILLIFLATVLAVLLAWAISGSWTNESYLTNTYLLKIDLTNLSLAEVFSGVIKKRALSVALNKRYFLDFPPYVVPVPASLTLTISPSPFPDPLPVPTPSYHPALEKRLDVGQLLDSATKLLGGVNNFVSSDLGVKIPTGIPTVLPSGISIPTSVPTNIQGITQYIPKSIAPDAVALLLSRVQSVVNNPLDSVELVISDILTEVLRSLTPQQLGLSQIYTVSFWGYCRGFNANSSTYNRQSDVGNALRLFSSENVNITWCSPPKAAYALDPAVLIRTEVANLLKGYVPEGRLPPILNDLIRSELKLVEQSLNNTLFTLPQDLENSVGTLNRVTKACFALMLSGCILAVIVVFDQLIGWFADPHSGCLSFLNFLFLTLMCLTTVVGCALTTGVYIYVRGAVNDAAATYGIRCSLSINFYAFAWVGAAAAIIFFLVEVIGLICGCCFPQSRKKMSHIPFYPYRDAVYVAEK